MKQDKQKRNWLIDAALLGGFLASLWLDLTGVAAHQWLGLAVAAFAGYHLWRHWPWVEAVTGRFFGRTNARSRVYYLVDAGLALGFVAIAATGVVISTWLDLALVGYGAWRTVHIVASVAMLGLLLVKIGLHWRWIVDVARRRVFNAPARPVAPAAAPVATNTAAGAAALGRRDFVRLMAGVGAVALVSGVNAFGALKVDAVEATGSEVSPNSASASTAAASSAVASSAASSSSCQVRCNKGCSYPGRCRRYTDSNNNGLCDLGECLS